MSHKDTVAAVATESGWQVHQGPWDEQLGVIEYRKRNGRKVAYVRVMFGTLSQVVQASWADNLQGFEGRAIGNHNAGKLDWVLHRLQGEVR